MLARRLLTVPFSAVVLALVFFAASASAPGYAETLAGLDQHQSRVMSIRPSTSRDSAGDTVQIVVANSEQITTPVSSFNPPLDSMSFPPSVVADGPGLTTTARSFSAVSTNFDSSDEQQAFATFSVQAAAASTPAVLYESTFRGGVVTGGFSVGATDSGTGSFDVNIPPGSTIRRAYLLAGRVGNAADLTVDLNGTPLTFNSANIFTTGFSTDYGGNSAVHAIDVTTNTLPSTTTYTLTVPWQNPTSNRYPEFYLYIAFDNSDLPPVTSAIFANTTDLSTSNFSWTLTTATPIFTSFPVGLAIFGGYAATEADDRENVTVNGTLVGDFGGPDFNGLGTWGSMAGFQYYNGTLTGYGDDNADQAMAGVDALSNIQALIPYGTTSFSVDFSHAGGRTENHVWALFLTSSSGLGIVKTVDPAQAAPGDTVTYTIDFRNSDLSAATEVTISDPLPGELSAATDQWDSSVTITRTSGYPHFSWDVSNLPPGAGGIITLTGVLSQSLHVGQRFTNTATITGSYDVTVTNNSSSVAIDVTGIIYVDRDATGTATGISWTDAFTNVQDALAVTQSGDEIWVAEGVYYPDEGVGQTNDDRNSTFQLKNGVALYGGFAGTETARDERDWTANVTVLSGDIDGNDTVDTNGVVTDTANLVGSNTYHVVYIDGTTTPNIGSTLIDGVTITGGQANAGGADGKGGGFYCNGQGSGSVCSPSLSNVTFSGNSTTGDGGAIYNDGVTGVSSPTLTNVTLSGNSAAKGGAMYNNGFSGNSSPTLINVTFSGNSAARGGAIYNDGVAGVSSPTLTNVILWGNEATTGSQIQNDSATPTLSYSLVEGENPGGTGNLDGTLLANNPLFITPVDPASAPTTGGNLRLHAISPAVNVGDNTLIPSGVTTDLDGNPRIVEGTVDLGAFEVQESDYQSVCRNGLVQGETYIFGSTGITATVDTLGSLSELCVTLTQADHPNAPSGLQTGLHWTITHTASSEDWSLTLSALVTDTLEANDRFCRYDGALWDCGLPANHTTAGNRIIRSGVTQLSDWAVGSLAPTASTVDRFTAERLPDRVRLHWTTLNEVGLTGFHLYRSADAAGPGERITAAPLPGQGGGGLEGFAYAYEDFTPRPAEGAVFYWLEELHTNSAPIRHGPQRIAAEGLRVFLPVVER